ncbi:MAG TPA: insulinase family protein [Vicinamibacterales bacterium]
MQKLSRGVAAILLGLVLSHGSALAQAQAQAQASTGRETSAASVASYALSDGMPVDPDVLLGRLPNGLRYYVRPNAKPAKQIELRLVVKAGSVLEDDDQRGLAHFVEHMQFEGSRHFPDRSLTEFLASLGLSIGADANAATSFDETSYTLRVPSDRAGALDAAMTVLEDFAGGATLEPSGIDRQRPIVLAEWRRSLGAGQRTEDKMRGVELDGSRYVDRSPIGAPSVIESAQREQIARFYRDWYRPNLMAVIVVGDVDRNAVATMIRQHFSSLTNPQPERQRPAFDVPEHPGTRYAVVTDTESPATVVRISNLRPARNQGTVGGYRSIMLDQLFSQMLGDRLEELSQRANPPFLRAAAGRGLFPAPRTRDEAIMQALVPNDGVSRGLEALVTELQRVSRFGFTATELERAKQANMAGSERITQESPDRESSSRADEYTRNFLQDEALPTIWQELAFHRRFLPGVTLAEMNALAADWFPERNRLVLVSAPEAARTVLPTESQLAAVVASASAKRLDAYVDAGAGATLMDVPPTRGSITRTTAVDGTGITVWTLSNGATVVLRPTTLKADQILFRAVAPGGTSLAADDVFPSARVADDVIPAGGVGALSQVVLDRLLSSKALAVRPYISEIRHGMEGGSAPQDLETMFQLLHMRFTQPRADAAAFAAMKAQTLALLANQAANPAAVYGQALDELFSGNNPRRKAEAPETVAKWNLDASMAFYKARFADASNFTFIFVGSFTPEALKPLVETYVASLPATHKKETWRDLGIAPPTGVIKKTVVKGIAPRSEVSIIFSGAFDYSDANRLALRTAVMLLQARLNDAIREELGATYSIEASSNVVRLPKPEYRVRINWTSDPARVDSIVQRVFQEIQAARDATLTQEGIVRVRDFLLKDLEQRSQDNRYVLNDIARLFEEGDAGNLAKVNQEPANIAALSAAAIQQSAMRYLDTANYVQVTLMPEKK